MERLHWVNEIIHNLSFLVRSTLLYQFEATTRPHVEYNFFLFVVTENYVYTNFIDARKQRLCQKGRAEMEQSCEFLYSIF